MALKKDIKS